MGRVKEMFMKEQEMMFEMELGYEQWLRNNFTQPTGDELHLMERDSCKSLAVENQMIAQYSANRPDYQPYIGA
jgi:hypothetical protein